MNGSIGICPSHSLRKTERHSMIPYLMQIKLKSNQSQKILFERYMALTLLYVHALVRYAIFHSVGSDVCSLPHKGYEEVMTTGKRTIVHILLMLVNTISWYPLCTPEIGLVTGSNYNDCYGSAIENKSNKVRELDLLLFTIVEQAADSSTWIY